MTQRPRRQVTAAPAAAADRGDPARHRLGGPRRELRPAGADDRRAAAGAGARLVLLTEMFSTGFSMTGRRSASPSGGPSSQFLVEQAREHASGSVGRAPRFLPTSVPTTGARQQLRARRRRTARCTATARSTRSRYGGEDQHFRAGDELVHGRRSTASASALFVCYDLRFADEFWQLAPTTDVYLVPANWPAARRAHWMALLQARAIENQAYVVGCNRVGDGGGLELRRRQPHRRPARRAARHGGSQGESILLADVDPATRRRRATGSGSCKTVDDRGGGRRCGRWNAGAAARPCDGGARHHVRRHDRPARGAQRGRRADRRAARRRRSARFDADDDARRSPCSPAPAARSAPAPT